MPTDRSSLLRREDGFTLIELLVVIMIIGILAAIAIPAFLNQRSKASDASAKELARTAETTAETIGLDNGGSYLTVTAAKLNQVEPSIPTTSAGNNAYVTTGTAAATTYTVNAIAPTTGNTYQITRNASGTITRSCIVGTAAQAGACVGATNTVGSTGTW